MSEGQFLAAVHTPNSNHTQKWVTDTSDKSCEWMITVTTDSTELIPGTIERSHPCINLDIHLHVTDTHFMWHNISKTSCSN